MSLIRCHECREKISSTAKNCPKCGAKVPHFKWWLWVPVGLIAAFMAFAISVRPSSPQEAYDRAYSRCMEEVNNTLAGPQSYAPFLCSTRAEAAKRRFR